MNWRKFFGLVEKTKRLEQRTVRGPILKSTRDYNVYEVTDLDTGLVTRCVDFTKKVERRQRAIERATN